MFEKSESDNPMDGHPYTDMPHLTRCSAWVIAFTPYRGQSFLKRWFLPARFGHVWAFTEVNGESLIFDPYNGGYFMAATKGEKNQSSLGITPAVLASALLRDGNVSLLHYKARIPRLQNHFANCVPSCVTMVKLLLGLRVCAFTPRGLYKALLKKGAEPLNHVTITQFLAADQTRRSERILQTLNQ